MCANFFLGELVILFHGIVLSKVIQSMAVIILNYLRVKMKIEDLIEAGIEILLNAPGIS
jgi:hypothetical protein